ncbi:UDP-glycosyltransferase 88F5-like [Actinidia eriantha]|uniref:UDP-glycosyltransferase 88F5-like n=1 Tax=Actinidia eriantha TaxID=165200 RepID=UPI0025867DA8|nr:UDP-glycosyltransferase 88F5-like [Actinidia eriantha]
MKETIVLYPVPGHGHLVSMVELGKLILNHHSHYYITVLVPLMPSDAPTISSFITSIPTTLPLSFHPLPSPHQTQTTKSVTTAFKFFRLTAAAVRQALETISLSSTISALITSAVQDVSSYMPHNINIPTYYYFTSGASALALFLYFPTLHTQTTESFKDLARLVHIPGLPPINFSHLPQPILDREAEAYHYFLNFGACLPKSNGIIVNTFDSLEPRAIKAINNGDCTPKLTSPPPEPFYIGPIVAEAKDGNWCCV